MEKTESSNANKQREPSIIIEGTYEASNDGIFGKHVDSILMSRGSSGKHLKSSSTQSLTVLALKGSRYFKPKLVDKLSNHKLTEINDSDSVYQSKQRLAPLNTPSAAINHEALLQRRQLNTLSALSQELRGNSSPLRFKNPYRP